jgi:hypothetical protein
MRHIDASRGWSLVIGLLALAGISLDTSCLVPNEEHCQFHGGDLACEGRGFCVTGVEGRADSIASADDKGCIAKMPEDCEAGMPDQTAKQACVPVKYGLPVVTRISEMTEQNRDPATDTVEGIIAAVLLEEGLQYDASSEECQALLDGFNDDDWGEGSTDSFEGIVALRNIRVDAEQERETTSAARAAFSDDQGRTIRCFDGYFDAQLPALRAACVSSTDTTTGVTTELDTTATETSEGTATTGVTECMTSAECFVRDELRPFCVDMVCLRCDQAGGDPACAIEYPATPVCVVAGGDRGRCVECTTGNSVACSGKTPRCDGDTYACSACDAHEQCGEAACNFFTGACLPPVVHVGGATPDFDDLTTAVAGTDDVTIIVHAETYDESVTIGGNRTVALLAAEIGSGDPPWWIRNSGNAPQLTVGPGTTVLMDGLRLSSNLSTTAPSLRVSGGRAWIDRGRIILNLGGGIVAQTNSELVVRNSFVGGNGSGGDGSYGIDIIGADVRVLYSTIARNDETAVDSIHCSGGMVDVRNSIVVGRDASSIECPGIAIVHSALDEDIGEDDDGNFNVGAANLAWFTSGTGGDFHLTATGATVFADIARWTDGYPLLDIDGDARPNIDGVRDFAGADTIPR